VGGKLREIRDKNALKDGVKNGVIFLEKLLLKMR